MPSAPAQIGFQFLLCVWHLEISLYSREVSYDCLIALNLFYPSFLGDDDGLSYSTILLEVEVTMEILRNVFM